MRVALSLVMSLAGCVIPGVDEDGKQCPCAVGYSCNVMHECVSTLLDDAGNVDAHIPFDAFDLASDAGEVVQIGGEAVFVLPGWGVSLFRDISSYYTYNAKAFVDTPEMGGGDAVDNQPSVIVPLVEPFNEGFAVLCGEEIVEVPTAPTTQVPAPHVYKPKTPDSDTCPDNSVGCPDIPRDLYFAADSPTTARLLIAASSTGGGDGIFQIDSSWTESSLTTPVVNNNNTIVFDAAHLFDGQTTAQTYYSTNTNGVRFERLAGNHPIITGGADAGMNSAFVDDAEILADGTLALAVDADSIGDIQGIEQITPSGGMYPVTQVPNSNPEGFHLVTGDLSRLPQGDIFAVAGAALILHKVGEKPVTVAYSADPNWLWYSAAIPPMRHSLGKQVTFYLISSNRSSGTNGTDHILAFTSPY